MNSCSVKVDGMYYGVVSFDYYENIEGEARLYLNDYLVCVFLGELKSYFHNDREFYFVDMELIK